MEATKKEITTIRQLNHAIRNVLLAINTAIYFIQSDHSTKAELLQQQIAELVDLVAVQQYKPLENSPEACQQAMYLLCCELQAPVALLRDQAILQRDNTADVHACDHATATHDVLPQLTAYVVTIQEIVTKHSSQSMPLKFATPQPSASSMRPNDAYGSPRSLPKALVTAAPVTAAGKKSGCCLIL